MPAWTTYVNRPSNTNASIVRIVIQDPDNVDISFALRFDFRTSNKEAEY